MLKSVLIKHVDQAQKNRVVFKFVITLFEGHQVHFETAMIPLSNVIIYRFHIYSNIVNGLDLIAEYQQIIPIITYMSNPTM